MGTLKARELDENEMLLRRAAILAEFRQRHRKRLRKNGRLRLDRSLRGR
jgi:hypothetical protein